MSCKIPYIEQRFRDVNPSLADTLNTKYSQIWDSVIESELFKKEDDTSKYLMATTNISRLQEQQDFIDKVNQDNSVPEGASVIENLNGYVNVNVLNLPEVTGVSTPTIKEGVEELFNENPELSIIGTPQQYSQYLETIFPDSKVKDIVYHGYKLKKDDYGRDDLKIEKFDKTKAPKGFYFTTDKDYANTFTEKYTNVKESGLIKAVVNLTNPKQQKDLFRTDPKIATSEGKDGFIGNDMGFEKENVLVVFEPEQIHILGNKQDIEGFKEFVSKQPKPTIDYTSLDVTASLDAETKAKIDYLRNNDDLTVQC
jgi:hypothetical protein